MLSSLRGKKYNVRLELMERRDGKNQEIKAEEQRAYESHEED